MKAGAVACAVAHHVEIVLLEHAQFQKAARKQYRVERKQRNVGLDHAAKYKRTDLNARGVHRCERYDDETACFRNASTNRRGAFSKMRAIAWCC